MHASTWDPWASLFEQRGYQPVAPGWPGDAATVAESRANPDPIANRGVAEVTDHFATIIGGLDGQPVLVGHSFGGLIAQRLLGMGLAKGAVAISPAQFRGVRRLPLVQLKTAFPVLGKPSNRSKAVSQTPEQFHQGFASAVPKEESDELYERYAIPAPALPLFESASANLSPKTAAAVDVKRERGPLLIIGGGKDRTVPEVTAHAEYRRYRHNPSITEYKVFLDRGHSSPIDHGWREIAEFSLEFFARHRLGGDGGAPAAG
jgi:pimeloyl-ACP methyl ester carboxylesterase